MRSGTSFFDLTIYKKTVNRFWPLWAANLVFWLFLLPFRGLMDIAPFESAKNAYRFALNVGDMATPLGMIFALIFSLLVAMAVCSPMYNARSANFMGALPCRREGQFLSTYTAGLTMLIGPNLAVFLLTLLVEVAGRSVVMSPLLFWLGALCAMEFFFYSFAVCIGQFAGHILALPVFYGIFNCIAIALYGLLNWTLDSFYFGFAGINGIWMKAALWLTPVAKLLELDINTLGVGAGEVIEIDNFHICGIYAIAAAVLAVCALLLYRRRHLETAGDIVAVKAMRPVFQYGVAVCAGLFFGFLMAQMFNLSEFGMAVWMVIWGVVGYFVARMLLDKTVRVFKKWKGALAVVIAFLLMFAVVGFDLTGYERRVPDPEDVASVQFSGLQGEPGDIGYSVSLITLDNPEYFPIVTELHRLIVKAGPDGDVPREYHGMHITFNVTYLMKDGSTVARRYSVPMGEDALALAQQLRDLPEVLRHTYRLDEIRRGLERGGRLETAQCYELVNKEYYDTKDYVFSEETASKLWEAVMTDFDEGLIGRHTVGAPSSYLADEPLYRLEFRFDVPVESTPVILPGTVEINGGYYEPHEPGRIGTTIYCEFAVQETSVHTLEVLKELLEPDNRYQEDPSLEDIMAGNARG